VTTAIAIRPQQSMRFRGRSFMAFVLAPLPPITGWLEELDKWGCNSPGFFVGRPIILDLAAVSLDGSGITELIGTLGERGIRVVGLEGTDPDSLGPSLPPLLKGGRQSAGVETLDYGTDKTKNLVNRVALTRDGAGVAIEDTQLFGVDSASTVHAFTLSGGTGQWTNKLLAHRSVSSPGSVGKWVAVGDYRGYVHLLSAGDGQLVGRVELDGSAIIAEPKGLAGGLLVQTQHGALALLMPQG